MVLDHSALQVVQRLSDLPQLEAFWREAQHHPNADYSQFELVCRLRPDVVRPHIVKAVGSRGPVLLLGRVESGRFEPTLGYAKPLSIGVRILNVLHEGIIGEYDIDDARRLLDHLASTIRSDGIDLVSLNHVREQSPLLEAFREQTSFLRFEKPGGSIHRLMQMPAERGGLLAQMKPKRRNWHNRKARELADRCKGHFQWLWHRDPVDVDALAAQLEHVAAKSYQRGLNAGFVNDEEHRERLRLFSRSGRLRICLLEVEGRPSAFWLGVVYGRTFHSWATAYDPDLRQTEPGNLMFHRVVDELVADQVDSFDFGLGDAFYKERFGTMSWRESNAYIFSPTPRGVALRSTLGGFTWLESQARNVLRSTGYLDSVKTRWRRKLSSD